MSLKLKKYCSTLFVSKRCLCGPKAIEYLGLLINLNFNKSPKIINNFTLNWKINVNHQMIFIWAVYDYETEHQMAFD